ncbi:16S rRNA (adenine(1518)-N(6)/adenine(1519)-N(6))-dimethyltransferase RsmA [Aquipuribacter sp. MA13-6]|uniref:16S rRNA (adenine(1518)-N(6)/adenine(1519)-N(6))- dimethyltransferase RsmA n=1 Tax=unclassified Aquipuribacter TaxID=2635084 RepID=UPI003EEC02B1
MGLGAAAVRALAARHGINPTKSKGQNFVIDVGTVSRIVRLAGVRPGDVVLEVGPGLGSLTLPLLSAGAHVVAVELDERLAAALPGTVGTHLPDALDRLHVVRADATAITAADLPLAPTRFVANLPYNVAVPLLLGVLQGVPSVQDGVVMVQSEVADRLCAGPGGRVYGVPSVKLAWYAAARRVGSVAPTVFWPVPRVDSGLVGFTRHDPPATAVADRAQVFATVDAAFGQRRKTLRQSLAVRAGSATRAQVALEAAGVAPSTRAERLGVAEFAAVADALQQLEPDPGEGLTGN